MTPRLHNTPWESYRIIHSACTLTASGMPFSGCLPALCAASACLRDAPLHKGDAMLVCAVDWSERGWPACMCRAATVASMILLSQFHHWNNATGPFIRVQDAEIMEQIDRDVMRTHPDMHFFSGDDAPAVQHRQVSLPPSRDQALCALAHPARPQCLKCAPVSPTLPESDAEAGDDWNSGVIQ